MQYAAVINEFLAELYGGETFTLSSQPPREKSTRGLDRPTSLFPLRRPFKSSPSPTRPRPVQDYVDPTPGDETVGPLHRERQGQASRVQGRIRRTFLAPVRIRGQGGPPGGFAPARPPPPLACQRFVNERARKDQDRLVPVRKWSYRWPEAKASARSRHGQSGRPATHLKTVVRKDLWVRVPRPPPNVPLTCAFAFRTRWILPLCTPVRKTVVALPGPFGVALTRPE